MNLTDEVVSFTREAGFARAGISPPTLSHHYIKAYQEYSHAEHYGTMLWMQKYYDFNAYLQEHFPWAKSVLVGVDNYYQPGDWPAGFPKIARYAWGIDYHKVVARKMKLVIQKIKTIEPKVIARAYVDTGPVMQKAFAVQAGLGWIGKNDLLIVPEIGSYCFIGILFLNLELQFNEPIADRCGDCQLCLKACPTGALLKAHTLDARRCTSYLNVEKEGNFTPTDSRNLHGWLYGCDTCQEICPYNQIWNRPGDPIYGEYFHVFQKSLSEWLNLTEYDFHQLFQNSPIRRLGFARWRRNLTALEK